MLGRNRVQQGTRGRRCGSVVVALALGCVWSAGLFATCGAEPTGAERFGPLAGLIGRWQGYSQKPDGSPPGLIERTYTYDLGGMFVRVESTIMFPPEVPETYFDVQRELHWISFDADAGAYRTRGFFSEGFATVETITIETAPLRIVIDSESIENGPAGMRTRHTLTLEGPDQLVDVFEIAMPGIGHRTYHTAHLRRVGG